MSLLRGQWPQQFALISCTDSYLHACFCLVAAKVNDPSQQRALLEEYLLQRRIGYHANIVDMLAGGMYKGEKICLHAHSM